MSEQRPRTGRRRPRQPFVPDTTVPSPCVKVCTYDPADELCQGCARNADEIRNWIIMSAEQKREVLARLPERWSGREADAER